MAIGVDLDEVLADYILGLAAFLYETHQVTISRDQFEIYSLGHVLGIPYEKELRLLNEFHRTPHFQNIIPTQGSQEGIRRLYEIDNELHVITARGEDVYSITEQWVATHFNGYFRAIHSTNAGVDPNGAEKKSAVCKRLGIKKHIDDVVHNALDCAAEGIGVVLFHRPWNASHTPLPQNVVRSYSWDDVPQKVRQLGNGN